MRVLRHVLLQLVVFAVIYLGWVVTFLEWDFNTWVTDFDIASRIFSLGCIFIISLGTHAVMYITWD